jgi:transposase
MILSGQRNLAKAGKRDGRWYYANGKRIIHADVNGSYNIGRKVVPTAFDGPGIAAPAGRAASGLPSKRR